MQFSGSPKPLKTLYRNWGNSPWPLQDAFFWQILVLARFNAINAGPKTRIRVLPLHRKSFKNESYLYKTAPRSKLNFLPHRSAWAGPQFSSQPCTRSKTRKPFIETDAIAPSYLNIKFFDGNLNGAIHLQFLRDRNFSGNDTGLSKILHCMTGPPRLARWSVWHDTGLSADWFKNSRHSSFWKTCIQLAQAQIKNAVHEFCKKYRNNQLPTDPHLTRRHVAAHLAGDTIPHLNTTAPVFFYLYLRHGRTTWPTIEHVSAKQSGGKCRGHGSSHSYRSNVRDMRVEAANTFQAKTSTIMKHHEITSKQGYWLWHWLVCRNQ